MDKRSQLPLHVSYLGGTHHHHQLKVKTPVTSSAILGSQLNTERRYKHTRLDQVYLDIMASNSQRTALVTGATGLLGREITAAFRQSPKWNVKGTGYSRADGVDILKVNLENEDLNELNTVLDETKYESSPCSFQQSPPVAQR